MNKHRKKPRNEAMYKAILSLQSVEECMKFFDDLCTVTELMALEQRYQVAVCLHNGMIYNDILKVETVEECKMFLEDLCTVNELRAMEQRYQVATYLHSGMIYSDILERTGASSATISRVNRSLQYGSGGYDVVFGRMADEEQA